tara:strand:- start:8 stop:229 length:222 start_codon:yes stop_codon:yes gene_type:complete
LLFWFIDLREALFGKKSRLGLQKILKLGQTRKYQIGFAEIDILIQWISDDKARHSSGFGSVQAFECVFDHDAF